MTPQPRVQDFAAYPRTLSETQHLWDEQPAPVQAVYTETAEKIVSALTQPSSRLFITLPSVLHQDGLTVSLPQAGLRIRTQPLTGLFKRHPSPEVVLRDIDRLGSNPNTTIRTITALTAFRTAHTLAFDRVPVFSHAPLLIAGQQAAVPLAQVRQALSEMCDFVGWMTLAERLFPPLAAHPRYDDKRSAWTKHLVEQGRLFADTETQALIDELLTRLQAGEVMRGLTLLIPYLDERHYRLDTYKVVVVPSSRIPFRAAFVSGACRLEEQRVRQTQQLSQSTRWQLISQLHRIHQAFEHLSV